jgi:membrane protein DedA with SNARE-associated domain
MNLQNIPHLLIEYRYWILVPLSLIEGPIVAFISGTLASLGYFNIFSLVLFFFARDMVMDGFYYFLGYFGSRTSFANYILRKIHIKQDHIDSLRSLWERHPARTMFLGKLSYGVSQFFIIAAGIIKMNIRKFFAYGAIVAVVQYVVLLLLGYFFGSAFGGSTAAIVENIQYAIAGATLILSGYYAFRWYISRRLSSKE